MWREFVGFGKLWAMAWFCPQVLDYRVGLCLILYLKLVEIPIIFVDTGYLFSETYQYANQLQEELNFRAPLFSAKMSPAFQEESFGKVVGTKSGRNEEIQFH